MNQPSKDTLLKFDDIRNSILQEEEGRVINSNLIHGLNNINDFTTLNRKTSRFSYGVKGFKNKYCIIQSVMVSFNL